VSDDRTLQERSPALTEAHLEAGDVAPTRATPATSPSDPLLGAVIDGKYRMEKLIGVGGMGRVYRGRNLRTDGPVAIKTLLPSLASDDSLVQRFVIEAQSASKLKHQNTIRIYDVGREGDLLFMVMELLDGEPLESLLSREKRIEPARMLHIMTQACRSLAEAHAAGLVHRDIKPDNVFLNRVGDEPDHVKVLDFGVAKLRQKDPGQATLTQAGMIFGTPRYMAPEQARALEIDGRSDIYALGVMMFECLTGKPPFDAADAVGILVQHVNEPIPHFASVAPDLPPMEDLEAIVRRCMAKQPDERFDDVLNLLNALEAASVRYGYVASGTYVQAAGGTVSMGAGAPNTPAAASAVNPGGFDALGVSGGPAETRFTMGKNVEVRDSGAHASVGNKQKIAGVALAAVVGLAALGGALAALVGGDAPAPAPPASEPNAAGSAEAPAASATEAVAVSPAAVAAALASATTELQAGVTNGKTRAAAFIARAILDSEPAGAQAVLADGTSVALPHTFVWRRAEDGSAAPLQVTVQAPGHRAATVTLEASTAPRVVTLEAERRSPRPAAERPPAAPAAEPTPRPTLEGGLEDPFATP
jgi:serine/threonine-protein kinase